MRLYTERRSRAAGETDHAGSFAKELGGRELMLELERELLLLLLKLLNQLMWLSGRKERLRNKGR